MIKDNKDFNMELLNTIAPSGYEKPSVEIFDKYMKDIGGTTSILHDKMHNSVWRLRQETTNFLFGLPTILIEAHIDSCSFLVSNLTQDGYVNIIPQGGIDKKVVQGQSFYIYNKDGKRFRAICPKDPIHTETKEQRDKINEISCMTLDCGCSSLTELKESTGIDVGDIVVYANDCFEYDFGVDGKYIVSQNLDDKAGVMCVYDLAKRIRQEFTNRLTDKYDVLFAVTGSEETGTRGATQLAQELRCDYVISIDCTFANNNKPAKYGNIKTGKGAVINFSPASNREFSRNLQDAARRNCVSHQLQATAPTGTNINAFQMHMPNCETVLISYPLESMHTPVEKVCWSDLDAVVDTVIAWLRDIEH